MAGMKYTDAATGMSGFRPYALTNGLRCFEPTQLSLIFHDQGY